MQLILMSGNSLRNRDWIFLVESALKPLFEQTYVTIYDHWAKAQPMADIDLEADKLAKLARGLASEYAIFAKSIGSVITLKDIAESRITPSRLIITGLPLNLIEEIGLPIQDWLKKLSVPTIIIQNSDDPAGSYSRIVDMTAAADKQNVLKLVEIPGNNTHDYNDLESLKSLVRDFIKTDWAGA